MSKSKSRRDNQGFSLIELIVVLAVMTILAALSVPMLTSAVHDMQLTADAKSIATTLTYAKVKSGSELARYQLSFTWDTGNWRLGKFNPGTGVYDLQDAENRLSTGVANSGITFKETSNHSVGPTDFTNLTDSSDTITFNSRGMPVDDTGTLSPAIVYLSSDNIDFAVSVSLSGKVQLWRYENDGWVAR